MWQVIINPSAGNGKAGKQWRKIEAALIKANITFTVHRSERTLHCAEIAKLLIEQGSRKLIGVGGDGTNHEIINGLMQQNTVPTNEVIYGPTRLGDVKDSLAKIDKANKDLDYSPVFKLEAGLKVALNWYLKNH